jgi:hypothetical protein
VNTLSLKALPYKDADRLVYMSEYWPHEPVVPGPPRPDFANWQAESKLLEGIAAYSGVSEHSTSQTWKSLREFRGRWSRPVCSI